MSVYLQPLKFQRGCIFRLLLLELWLGLFKHYMNIIQEQCFQTACSTPDNMLTTSQAACTGNGSHFYKTNLAVCWFTTHKASSESPSNLSMACDHDVSSGKGSNPTGLCLLELFNMARNLNLSPISSGLVSILNADKRSALPSSSAFSYNI